jgi:hypothetical protein
VLHRLHLLFLLLAACGLLAAGCGGEDDTPDTKGEAQQECLDEAAKIDDADARKIAEEACRGKAGEAGEEADKARDDVVKRCLEEARNLPEGDQRRTAEDICQAAQ